jgi:hypothetical protein
MLEPLTGAEAVGADEIYAYTVGIKHSTNTIKTEPARDNNAIPFYSHYNCYHYRHLLCTFFPSYSTFRILLYL